MNFHYIVEDLICHKHGKHYEGDMILTEEQRIALMTSEYNASDYRWPNYTIPIQFNESHSSEQNAEILSAIESIESISCVRFSNRTDETNYVQITVCTLEIIIAMEECGCNLYLR